MHEALLVHRSNESPGLGEHVEALDALESTGLGVIASNDVDVAAVLREDG